MKPNLSGLECRLCHTSKNVKHQLGIGNNRRDYCCICWVSCLKKPASMAHRVCRGTAALLQKKKTKKKVIGREGVENIKQKIAAEVKNQPPTESTTTTAMDRLTYAMFDMQRSLDAHMECQKGLESELATNTEAVVSLEDSILKLIETLEKKGK